MLGRGVRSCARAPSVRRGGHGFGCEPPADSIRRAHRHRGHTVDMGGAPSSYIAVKPPNRPGKHARPGVSAGAGRVGSCRAGYQ
ncbi:hypothetical protein Afil01_52220 [Actinorhabdospora filicis]|uniref:Uncharacterized protein n=1 Tax=Actinorhabdospora filicis TaxID=1785913 RepID=A0A9W6SR22_9ACTN|nr:hypothetical protein Afil01_52220 [Actinorhabdospora filicis]